MESVWIGGTFWIPEEHKMHGSYWLAAEKLASQEWALSVTTQLALQNNGVTNSTAARILNLGATWRKADGCTLDFQERHPVVFFFKYLKIHAIWQFDKLFIV